MIPAKNRERKCSTCKHYQPSPLWRKGWCRNPLLYDRNTNHLVESDSLACNRTFIDYWEPMQGPAQVPGPQARSSKPRIAPSIPMETMDAQGRRTQAQTVPPQEVEQEDAPPRKFSRMPLGRTKTPPNLVPDGEWEPAFAQDPSKVTQQIEQVEGPQSNGVVAATAAQRIKQARGQRKPGVIGLVGVNLWMVLAAIVLLAAIGGGAAYLKGNPLGGRPLAVVKPTATTPPPTPTGLGDPTATSKAVPPTVAATVPSNVIAVGGWVQVNVANLNVRKQAGASAAKVTVVTNGTKAKVIGGPTDADGLTWWQITNFDPANPANTGWCAGKYLTPIPAP